MISLKLNVIDHHFNFKCAVMLNIQALFNLGLAIFYQNKNINEKNMIILVINTLSGKAIYAVLNDLKKNICFFIKLHKFKKTFCKLNIYIETYL